MGEKLLAQRVIRLLRDTNGRSSKAAFALLDWARDQRDWLWPDVDWPDAAAPGFGMAGPWPDVPDAAAQPEGGEADPLSWDSLPALADAIVADDPEPALLSASDAVSDLLAFDAFERALLRNAIAFDRLPRLAALRYRLAGGGEDYAALLGRLAGAAGSDAARLVRVSGPVTLGLIYSAHDPHAGGGDMGVDWRFARVLDGGLIDPDRLIDLLAGERQQAALGLDDFAEHRRSVALMVRLLRGALETRAAGVNLLLYGPPGTGKTELARTVAEAAGATLYAVGEADVEGEEPSRLDRLAALRRSQRLLQRRGGSLLLFDEMEDLFAQEGMFGTRGEWRGGSKIFVNRLLEGNKVPTIWTSNALDAVDPAHLRRMTFILRMGYPAPAARSRIVSRVAEAEGLPDAAAGLERLLPAEEGATGVARSALRAAALAGGGAEEAETVGQALLLGLRGGRALPPRPGADALDLDLFEADIDVSALVERIAAPGAPADLSLLLTGLPGTGKTALAAHVALRLDRPLLVKRASDLLSCWVGGTEANLAAAFAEARDAGAVLLFDEADSLLHDRADAQRSWEVSQVNELLTWMDSHPLPFIAATNYPQRLDPAALRRFVFKIELKPLTGALAERAFARFFGMEAPAGLARVSGLTPGDFAVVARQLRYRPSASAGEILSLLEAEARAKPERYAAIGF